MSGATGTPRINLRETLSLHRVEKMSNWARTMFINVGFFTAFLLLIPSLASQFARREVVIEPILVPPAIAKLGLKPEVVANRLWDGLQEFAQAATTARQTIVSVPDSQLVEFSLPGAAISLDSLFAQLRQFFHIYETHISGEIVCEAATCTPETMRLRLRVVRDRAEIVDLPPKGTQEDAAYFLEAAAGVYSILDPFVAIAATAKTDPLRAKVLAGRLVRSEHPDAKWAHNLIGDLAIEEEKIAEAISAYRAALALDPEFLEARAGLGQALVISGDREGGKAELDAVRQRDPTSALAAEGFAILAIVEDDKPEAVRQFLVQAERFPLEPHYPFRAGQFELQLGNLERGRQLLRDALDLDPGHQGALQALGESFMQTGEAAAAQELFREWTEYAPQVPVAHAALGYVSLQMQEYAEAEVALARSLELEPASANTRLDYARTLAGLQRLDDAIAQTDQVTAADPLNGDAVSLLGTLHAQNRQPEKARELYSQFLADAPADHPARAAIAEALSQLGQ